MLKMDIVIWIAVEPISLILRKDLKDRESFEEARDDAVEHIIGDVEGKVVWSLSDSSDLYSLSDELKEYASICMAVENSESFKELKKAMLKKYTKNEVKDIIEYSK